MPSSSPFSGRPGADQPEDEVDDLLADGHPPDQLLHPDQRRRIEHRLELLLDPGGRGDHHPPLGFGRRVVDVDLQQEPVELRFRQRIGAFLLDRVLRRQDVERLGNG